ILVGLFQESPSSKQPRARSSSPRAPYLCLISMKALSLSLSRDGLINPTFRSGAESVFTILDRGGDLFRIRGTVCAPLTRNGSAPTVPREAISEYIALVDEAWHCRSPTNPSAKLAAAPHG